MTASSAERPAAEWIAAVSTASSGRRGGRIPRRRRASIVLPEPGRADEEQVVPPGGGDLERPPGQHLAAHVGQVGRPVASRLGGARGGRSRRPLVRGQEGQRVLQGLGGVHGKAGREGRLPVVRGGDDGRAQSVPAREEQHGKDAGPPGRSGTVEGDLAHEQHVGHLRQQRAPSAARSPTAVARSNEEPYLRRPAGARLTVMRRSHLKGKPQLRSAARMRDSLSRTAESASPTMVKRGKPGAESASTRTRCASTPRTAAVIDVASMPLSSMDGGREPPSDGSLHGGWAAGGPSAGGQSWAEPVSIVRTSPAAIRDPRRPFEAWRSRTVVPCWAAIEPSVSPGWMR